MSEHTEGPWEYVPSTEHHGPYVAGPHGGDICDCYTMSNLSAASVRNGGDSYPIHFQAEAADANARLIAAAPDMLEALRGFILGATSEKALAKVVGEDVLRDARAVIAKATGEQQ